MIYLKLYEDYEEPLFKELTSDNYRGISRESYIKFSEYSYKKDLIKFIKSKLGSIFAHNDFLTDLEKCYHLYAEYGTFHIIERKHLPFTISLKITDEDWFMVRLTYYCHNATYAYWNCDGLKGFMAFLKYLSSQPKKDEDWVGKNLLRNPFSIEFGSQFYYPNEKLQSLVDRLNISKFNVKLNRKKAEAGHSYATWELVIGDMLFFTIYYVSSINCFGISIMRRDLTGKENLVGGTKFTCFTEVGLYYLLEKEYEKLEGMYYV
jgi:hypothetical protein